MSHLLPKLALHSDVVFRRLFDEAPLLLSLLNGLLRRPRHLRLRALTILPPQLAGPLATDKESTLDLRAESADGRQFHIELQVRPFLSYPERALYYWAGLYHGQLEKGDAYEDLRPAVSIHILHFALLPGGDGGHHQLYELRERDSGRRLSDHLAVHTIEMGKFQRGPGELSSDESRWLYFLKHGHQMSQEEIEELAMPEITSADEKLRVISQDRLLRVQHEQREKAERDAIAWEKDHITAWLREGRREGRREGLDEGRRGERQEGLLRLLGARGLAVSPELRALVLACHDLERLGRCLDRALTISSPDELLADLRG